MFPPESQSPFSHNTMSNDLIIDEGFVVLNNYTKSVKSDDDNDAKKSSSDEHLIPRCSFASYSNALSIPLDDAHRAMLLNDCSLVFTARTKDDSDGYSTGSTFFLPCLMKPRCTLEALAQRIFRAHVDTMGELINDEGEKELLYDPERSGAEWWTLVLNTPSNTDARDDDEKADENDDDDDDDEGDDEVGIHFDADYGLEEQLPNYMLHPRVATITYLSDTGVPTLILDKRSPPPMDIKKKSLNGNIRKAWLSHPVFGKHVAFDGRLLHGAPGEYFPSIKNKSSNVAEPKAKRLKVEGKACTTTSKLSGKRITFMVNIWLNHCPLESEPLEEELIDKLTTPWENVNGLSTNHKAGDPFVSPFQWHIDQIDSPDAMKEPINLAASSGLPARVENVVICNRHVDIMFGASMEDMHKVSKLTAECEGGSIPILMEDGVFNLTVGNEASSEGSDEDEDEQ